MQASTVVSQCTAVVTAAILILSIISGSVAFTRSPQSRSISRFTNAFRASRNRIDSSLFMSTSIPIQPFETSSTSNSNDMETEFNALSVQELKSRLLNLVPRMTGKKEETEEVVALVNCLESKYEPVLTLDFFNMAMAGEWQLLFSTNMLGRQNPNLRLRELIQRIEPNGKKGNLTNVALWDHISEEGGTFDTSGTMNIMNSYSIGNQGAARMQLSSVDHAIRLSKGSKIPNMDDIPKLVGMIHNAMPSELFDLGGLGLDTTYMDGNLRIVRLTANFGEKNENMEPDSEEMENNLKLLKYEGVRNIFIRKDSMEINPMQK